MFRDDKNVEEFAIAKSRDNGSTPFAGRDSKTFQPSPSTVASVQLEIDNRYLKGLNSPKSPLGLQSADYDRISSTMSYKKKAKIVL